MDRLAEPPEAGEALGVVEAGRCMISRPMTTARATATSASRIHRIVEAMPLVSSRSSRVRVCRGACACAGASRCLGAGVDGRLRWRSSSRVIASTASARSLALGQARVTIRLKASHMRRSLPDPPRGGILDRHVPSRAVNL